MPIGNPDSVLSMHSNTILDSNEDLDILNLETLNEEHNRGMEDEESTPVLPQTPNSDLSSSMGVIVDSPNFNQSALRVI